VNLVECDRKFVKRILSQNFLPEQYPSLQRDGRLPPVGTTEPGVSRLIYNES